MSLVALQGFNQKEKTKYNEVAGLKLRLRAFIAVAGLYCGPGVADL